MDFQDSKCPIKSDGYSLAFSLLRTIVGWSIASNRDRAYLSILCCLALFGFDVGCGVDSGLGL
jgi:hypothetical protein